MELGARLKAPPSSQFHFQESLGKTAELWEIKLELTGYIEPLLGCGAEHLKSPSTGEARAILVYIIPSQQEL